MNKKKNSVIMIDREGMVDLPSRNCDAKNETRLERRSEKGLYVPAYQRPQEETKEAGVGIREIRGYNAGLDGVSRDALAVQTGGKGTGVEDAGDLRVAVAFPGKEREESA